MLESNKKKRTVNFENSEIFDWLHKSVLQQVVVIPTPNAPPEYPAEQDEVL